MHARRACFTLFALLWSLLLASGSALWLALARLVIVD